MSGDGLYRWALSRDLGGSSRLLWVMLNPSTATDTDDDPTIRRCMAFARDWGFGAMDVANLFALRSTDPGRLRSAHDPVGNRCDYFLDRLCVGADAAVLAWGSSGLGVPGFVDRAAAVTRMVLDRVEDVRVLGRTATGHPRHPLFVRADVTWSRVSEASATSSRMVTEREP